jgi:hypothetical protein
LPGDRSLEDSGIEGLFGDVESLDEEELSDDED